jgi:hypothetical protein
MGKLPLPLAVCKDTSRTFSTCRKVKKVQEKSGGRRFWKYDVIQVYIKTDSRQKQAEERSEQTSGSQTYVTLLCCVVYINILCCVVLLWLNKSNRTSLNLCVIRGLLQDNLSSEHGLLSPGKNLLLTKTLSLFPPSHYSWCPLCG